MDESLRNAKEKLNYPLRAWARQFQKIVKQIVSLKHVFNYVDVFSGLKFRHGTSVCLIRGKNVFLNWGSQHFFQV